ncbi:hypothetical protein [Desulfosporosinus orientis]|uniref:hypothetical protein n=1 Tax=Desulfosporosinus orientis TaxID=1563 RepID=UPI0002DA0CAF|nr:hypothetical protein [Desulfosporosinus orientis]
MTKKDVCLLGKKAPFTKIIVVHMEAWNHCTLSRQELKKHIYSQNQSAQIYVPNDGEIIPISFQSR